VADPDIAGGSIIPPPLSFPFSPPSDPFWSFPLPPWGTYPRALNSVKGSGETL